MNTRIVALCSLLVVLGGCVAKSKPADNCKSVGAVCAAHPDCCSAGCEASVCACNSVEGGLCATNDDCCAGMICRDNACATGCRANGEGCGASTACCSNFFNGTTCAACNATGTACKSVADCCSGN